MNFLSRWLFAWEVALVVSNLKEGVKMAMEGILVTVLKLILDNMSTQLRQMIVDAITSWEKVAAQTASPWDDLLVRILKVALEIK